jgi:thiol-disulfide isomerase/thioredoxin
MKNKKDKSQVEEKNVEVVEEEASPWYYFYSVGCGFCKKLEPIIDELNDNGNDILKLDLSIVDNKNLKMELEKEYNTTPEKPRCGTPWLINAETGKQICGYRDKDTIRKWLDGEDIPPPPRPKGPIPKLPFHGASKKEISEWKKEYKKWSEENKHLPNVKSAKELLERPRPKSNPPLFPNLQSTEKDLEEFKKKYEIWYKDNTHMPSLQPAEVLINRIMNSRRAAGVNQNNSIGLNPNQEARLTRLEQKMDKLIKHLGVK